MDLLVKVRMTRKWKKLRKNYYKQIKIFISPLNTLTNVHTSSTDKNWPSCAHNREPVSISKYQP